MRRNLRLAAIGSAAALLAVPACAGSGMSGAEDSSDTLEIWHAYAGEEDKVAFIDYALQTFEEEHPDVAVKEVPAEHSSYKTKLSAAVSSGNPPDVFYTLPGGYLNAFVEAGQVEPLDDELAVDGWGDSFLPNAMPSVTFDGKPYAVPIDIDATLMWYNKALFAEHGWAVPETWDQFLTLCEQIKDAGVVPIALGNKDSWPATFWFQYPEMRLRGSGAVDDFVRGEPGATLGPEATEAAGVLDTLREEEYLPEGANGMSDQEANILFLNGEAAMVLNGTWQIGMSADAPDGFELGYFPFPTMEGGEGDQSDVLAGVAASFAVAESSQNKEAATAFLRHLTSPEVMRKYVELRQTMSAVKGATREQEAGEMLYEISSQVIGDAGHLDPFYDTAMKPTAADTYYSTLQALVEGSIEPDDAAADLESALKSSD